MNSSSVIRATREFAPVLHSSAAALRVMSSQIQRSTYHSYQHPSPPPFSDVSKSILSAALARVPEHGFTQDSLRLGAKDVGYLSVSTNLFPQGVFDLILYYLASKRLALHDVTNSGNGYAQTWQDGKPGVGSRVRTLMLDRLRMNGEAGVVKRWPEALAVMAQPIYVPQSIAELGRLADDIWFLAGDKSVDTSWYTKRAMLSAIYAAAEVHQTQDTSHGYTDTEKFVDSRLSELQSARVGIDSVSEWLSFSGHSFINVLRSKGVRI